MKIKKWNKGELLSGIGGGILGSMLTFAAVIVAFKFEGTTTTNMVTLIAGLGGGIISGLLTLGGVKYTIDEQKRKERKDSIPQKIASLYKFRKSIEECRDSIVDLKVSIKTLKVSKNLEEFQNQVQIFQEEEQRLESKLIEESLQISSEIYEATIRYVNIMRKSSYDVRLDSLNYSSSDIPEKTEEIEELIDKSCTILIKGVNEFLDTVSLELNKLKEEMFD
ncbi:hypothetical protein [Bacillus thuringiensis]|uniref:hypothetical protein n=1 Tax=Bacillus thuringiensis TaxID=1428 RepID=UPI000A395FC0|nr:hypothetical protein [Bacillus thuringiensis]OUA56868.1 hypothetical protein BK781_18900 [Bacillus thuringiensis serovar aizawai]